MSTAGGSVGELLYGSFYLPAVAFGYLSTHPGNEFHQYIANINVPLVAIDPSHLLYILYSLTAISFLGAIQAHGITRAIYGPDGPSDRPKNGTVQIRHQLEIGIQQLGEFYGKLRWRMAPKVLYFVPMRLLRRLTWLSGSVKIFFSSCDLLRR